MNSLNRGFILAGVLAVSGCGVTFDVEVESSTTIKSGGLFQNLVADAFGDLAKLDLSNTQAFKNAGVGKDDVDSVKLTSLKLQVESPEDATLEFIDAIEFFVAADGEPKRLLASKKSIPNDATSVMLDVEEVELAPYVTAPSMQVTTKTKAHAPKKDTTIKATLVFAVDPKFF